MIHIFIQHQLGDSRTSSSGGSRIRSRIQYGKDMRNQIGGEARTRLAVRFRSSTKSPSNVLARKRIRSRSLL